MKYLAKRGNAGPRAGRQQYRNCAATWPECVQCWKVQYKTRRWRERKVNKSYRPVVARRGEERTSLDCGWVYDDYVIVHQLKYSIVCPELFKKQPVIMYNVSI